MRNQRSIAPAFVIGLFVLALSACASQQVAEPIPTAAYLSGKGVYEVKSYSDFPDVADYAEATIW